MFLKGIEGVKPAGDRNYFKPGEHLVEILSCRSIPATESAQNRNSFIVEARVVESTSMRVGEEAAQVVSWETGDPEKNNRVKMAYANVRQFLDVAVGGIEDGQIQEVFNMVTSEANPLKGSRMRVKCRNQPTKAGGDFTKHF